MKIHHLRNATLVIEAAGKVILVDPMLGKRGSLFPFTMFRYKARRNPLVELPENSPAILDKVTHCLITHLHPDHLDSAGEEFLRNRKIPIVCSHKDEATLSKRGLLVETSLKPWVGKDFLGGKVIGVPATHGYGWVQALMGNVMGFYLALPALPTLYISADTVFTNHVAHALSEYKPDIAVVACGTARLDIGKPLLMDMNDILKFVEKSPKKVIANHLEALNHCPTTRTELKEKLAEKGLLEKVYIPLDGEAIAFEAE